MYVVESMLNSKRKPTLAVAPLPGWAREPAIPPPYVVLNGSSGYHRGMPSREPRLKSGTTVRGSAKLPNDMPAGEASVYLLRHPEGAYYRLEHVRIGAPLAFRVSAMGYETQTLPRVVARSSDKAALIEARLQKSD